MGENSCPLCTWAQQHVVLTCTRLGCTVDAFTLLVLNKRLRMPGQGPAGALKELLSSIASQQPRGC
jgi:hypothetical protein